MRIAKYEPQWFEALSDALESFPMKFPTGHRPFMDYYYWGNPWCDYWLLLHDDDRIAGGLGLQRMPFQYGDRSFTLGYYNNYFALEKGVGHGRALYKHAIGLCDFGTVLGGSEDAHRFVVQPYKWDYFHGVQIYRLNERSMPRPGEALWRVAAKKALALRPRLRIEKTVAGLRERIPRDLSVKEEEAFSEDMLSFESPFVLRYAPDVAQLNWRYATGLSFVRYRVFRLSRGAATVGYVVLNLKGDQIIVSLCDGDHHETAAYGTLLCLREMAKEGWDEARVLLATSHLEMQKIYGAFGMKPSKHERLFAFGREDRPTDVEGDTSEWLVNYDWGDNGLRMPFLDQRAGE